MSPEFQVWLRSPDGDVLEVSDRITRIDAMQEAAEEDLLELRHGDLGLQLADLDGAVEAFFHLVGPNSLFEVEVLRKRAGRRVRWERVFAGVLELPWSLQYDRKDLTASVQAFSFSKLLENASAETVQRNVTGRTGSVTAAAQLVTVSDVTDLLPGDEITLRDDAEEETRTIATVGASSVTTTEPWDNTFASAALTLETPYHRDKSIAWLVDQLFTQAGIDEYDFDAQQLASGTPFGSRAPSDFATVNSWVAIDVNTHDFTLEERNPSGNDFELWLIDDGVDLQVVDSFTDGIGAGYGSDDFSVEYDPQEDEVWISLKRQESGFEKLAYVTSGGSGSVNNIVTGVGTEVWGVLRRLYEHVPTMGLHPDGTEKLKRWDLAVKSSRPVITVPSTLKMEATTVFDDRARASGLYETGGATWVRVWTIEAGNWAVEGDFKISDSTGVGTAQAYDTGTEIAVFGSVGAGAGHYTVARSLGGIIPYADFEGLSVGGALRELAIIAVAYVSVDHNRIGIFRGRSNLVSKREVDRIELQTPIERESMPVTELYRSSVAVVWVDSLGEDRETIRGDTGDSQRRLSIESRLVTNAIIAEAVASAYAALLSVVRGEEQVTVPEGTELVRPLTQVVLEGRTYDVLEATSDLEDEEQELRLVEAP